MKQRLLLLIALCCLALTRAAAQVEIIVPTADDTVVCNGAPLTMEAVTNGYHSHTVSLAVDDQFSSSLPIGFTFNWYGTAHTHFLVSSNGYLSFNTSLAGSGSAWSITTGIAGNTDVKNTVMGIYMDLDMAYGGTVTYGVAGVAPYRKLVVTFCNCHFFSCTSSKATFQIILYETTDIAEVHTKLKNACTSWNSGRAIQGVQNATASAATAAPGRNYSSGSWTVSVPNARRFTPNTLGTIYTCDTIDYNPIPDSSSTIYWYSGSTYLATGPTLTVNPTEPTTYQAWAVWCGDTSRDQASVTIGNGPVITALNPTAPSVCGLCDGTLNLQGLDPGSSDTINYTFNGVPQPPVVVVPDVFGSATLTGLCAGVYDNLTDKVGYCISDPYGPITITDPAFNIAFVSSEQPTVCGACNGSITLSGLIPGTYDTLNYQKDGVPQDPIYFIATSTYYTMTNLCAGLYSDITVKMNSCVTAPIGPFYIVNPAFGISSVTHTDATCSMSDGTITIFGLTPGQTITINYYKNGVPQPPYTTTSSSSGTITLTGLSGGTAGGAPDIYSGITATLNTCVSSPMGPVSISLPPLIPISITNVTQPSECGKCNGSITLKATPPGVIDSVFYRLGGIPQPAVLYAAAPDSTVTLFNLCAGTYNNFFIKVGLCPTTTITTPAVLSDPPTVASFSTVTHYGCNGDTVYFENTSTSPGAPNLYYLWNFGDGTSDTVANPVHTFTAIGTYNVTLTVSNHYCNNSVTIPVAFNHPIKAIFTATTGTNEDDTVCQFTPLTITNTSVGTPPTYAWSFGDGFTSTAAIPDHSFNNTGVYTIRLIATNFVPCSDTAYETVFVDSQSTAVMSVTDTVICQGSYITFSSVFSTIGLTGYTWNFGNGDSIKNVNPIVYAYNTTGNFTVTETSYYRICETAIATRNVVVVPEPVINLGPDTSICPGGDGILIADNINAATYGARWLWNTGATSSSIAVNVPGIYYTTVSVGNCQASDSVTVNNDCYMSMPNIFTPNGDGINDYFYPRQLLTKGLTDFKMEIYNRWGQMVFTTAAVDGRGWDGMYNGTVQPEGVYIFVIDATFKDGAKEHHQGNITLLR